MCLRSFCVLLVLLCISIINLAEETELPYGPTVIPILVNSVELESQEWGPDDEIWLEVEYLLSPVGEAIFVEPAERLWFVGEHAIVILGATGQDIPKEILRRGMGWVRLHLEGDAFVEEALAIYPRRDRFRLGGEPAHLQAALSQRLPGVDASYLSQVANFLAGNLANLDVQGTSYSVVGYGPVINDVGEWVGEQVSVPGQNLFETVTDGIDSAISDATNDVLKVRGEGIVSVAVANDDATHGDSVLISATESDGDPSNELQNLWQTVTADTGSAAADSQTDTLTVAGSGGLSTVIIGDTLTISGATGTVTGSASTAGQVTFWDTTSTLTGSDDLFWDGTNQRLGIGTTSPDEALTVSDGNFEMLPGNPRHVGSITDDLNTALDGAHGIFVSGKYAYVASAYDGGVEILDVSDPSDPTHVGAIFDDGTTALDGAHDIFVSGRHAYVASIYDDGVEILDVSDPSNPIHVGAIFDDGTTALDYARSIYVSGKYAYVASTYDHGVEILDVSDPSNPTHVGAITDDGLGGTIALNGASAIYVSGKYAFVTAVYDNGVEILDVSDPSNPTHVGAIFDDGTTELQSACSITISGKYAYVASYNDSGVEILDVSDPSNPTHVGAITDDETTALAGARSIYLSGKYAFVASQSDHGVEILDVSDPANPTHAGAIFDDGSTELDNALGIYVCGKYAYVAARDDDGVEILDISGIVAPGASIGALSTNILDVSENAQVGNNACVHNSLNVGPGGIYSQGELAVHGGLQVKPNNPTHLGAVFDDVTTALNYPAHVAVSGDYAYVASQDDDGIEILDVSDPSNPTHVSAVFDDGTTALDGAYGLAVSGKYLYVASAVDDGVEILDVTDPSSPTHVGSIVDDGPGGSVALDGAIGIVISGKYAYVTAQYDDGVAIIDISDPTTPTHLGSIFDDGTTALSFANGITVSGHYVFATGGAEDGIEILDVSDPANPTHVAAIFDDMTTELDGAHDVAVSGKYLYVASLEDDGVEILDISDPSTPTHVGAITDDGTMALDGAWSIVVSGNYAYVTSVYDDGLEILDVSDPTNPTHVAVITDDTTSALGGAFYVAVAGNTAYVTSSDEDGMEIISLSGIDAPNASIGAVEAGSMMVDDNLQVGNNAHIRTSLNVGPGGIYSQGELAVGNDTFIDGDLTITGSCSGCSSDLALKQDLLPIDHALEKIMQLNGYTFHWTDQAQRETMAYPGRQLGVIAQEVEPFFPELVGIDSRGYKFIRYQKLVVPLIEAIKELRSENEAIRLENRSIRYDNDRIRKENEKIRNRLETLETR